MKTYKVTDTHFAVFKAAGQRYIDFFGLKGWNAIFQHTKLYEDYKAEFEYNIIDRIAYIRLNLTWTEQPTKEALAHSAFHEVLEWLLSPLAYVIIADLSAQQKNILERERRHELIYILMNAYKTKHAELMQDIFQIYEI